MNFEFLCRRRPILTFFFSTAQAADSIACYFVFAGDHFVQALVAKVGVEAPLDDSEEVLGVIFPRTLVEFDASVEPSYGSPHRLPDARSYGEAGYCERSSQYAFPLRLAEDRPTSSNCMIMSAPIACCMDILSSGYEPGKDIVAYRFGVRAYREHGGFSVKWTGEEGPFLCDFRKLAQ